MLTSAGMRLAACEAAAIQRDVSDIVVVFPLDLFGVTSFVLRICFIVTSCLRTDDQASVFPVVTFLVRGNYCLPSCELK